MRRGWAAPAAALLAALLLAACEPKVEPAGAPVRPSALEDDALLTSDGTHLPLRHWLPEKEPPKAVILALHGMNDYSNAFAMPGAWWAKEGIATYAYDQRGFGGSTLRGVWPGAETLVDDLDSMVRLLHQRYPGVPLYILGESMGGAVAMAAFARPERPEVSGVILSAPAVWGRETMDVGKRVLLFLAGHLTPWHHVTGEGLHIVPSDNREMLIALSKDPMVIKETRVDAVWGLANLMDTALAASARLDDVPLLILYGEHDQVIPKEPTREMIASLPPDPRQLRRIAIYPKGYHMLLRDLQAKTVWRDVLDWMTDDHAPLASGADKTDLAALGQPPGKD